MPYYGPVIDPWGGTKKGLDILADMPEQLERRRFEEQKREYAREGMRREESLRSALQGAMQGGTDLEKAQGIREAYGANAPERMIEGDKIIQSVMANSPSQLDAARQVKEIDAIIAAAQEVKMAKLRSPDGELTPDQRKIFADKFSAVSGGKYSTEDVNRFVDSVTGGDMFTQFPLGDIGMAVIGPDNNWKVVQNRLGGMGGGYIDSFGTMVRPGKMNEVTEGTAAEGENVGMPVYRNTGAGGGSYIYSKDGEKIPYRGRIVKESKLPQGYNLPDSPGIEAIPGSPAAQKRAEEELKQDMAFMEKKEALKRQAGNVEEAEKRIGWWSSGLTGQLLSNIRRADAGELKSIYESITSETTRNTIQGMKEQTRTGATGLGQVSIPELNMLTSAITELSPGFTEEEQRRRLGLIKGYFETVNKKLEIFSQAKKMANEGKIEAARQLLRENDIQFTDNSTGAGTTPPTGPLSIEDRLKKYRR